jgi:hypothetical protein
LWHRRRCKYKLLGDRPIQMNLTQQKTAKNENESNPFCPTPQLPTTDQSSRASFSNSEFSSMFSFKRSKFLDRIEPADPNRSKHCFKKRKRSICYRHLPESHEQGLKVDDRAIGDQTSSIRNALEFSILGSTCQHFVSIRIHPFRHSISKNLNLKSNTQNHRIVRDIARNNKLPVRTRPDQLVDSLTWHVGRNSNRNTTGGERLMSKLRRIPDESTPVNFKVFALEVYCCIGRGPIRIGSRWFAMCDHLNSSFKMRWMSIGAAFRRKEKSFEWIENIEQIR